MCVCVCALDVCACVRFRCVCVRALQMCVCACVRFSAWKTSHTARDCYSHNLERFIWSPYVRYVRLKENTHVGGNA